MIVIDAQYPIFRREITYCAPTVLRYHHNFVLLGIKSIRISTIGASTLTPLTFNFENFIALRSVIFLRLKITARLTRGMTPHGTPFEHAELIKRLCFATNVAGFHNHSVDLLQIMTRLRAIKAGASYHVEIRFSKVRSVSLPRRALQG
jgi:hypothetical protein